MRCMSESVETATDAYLRRRAFLEEVSQRQTEVLPELCAAIGQLEAGIAAIQGIIRAKNLTPSRLNDMVEGLHGRESLALHISMLRDLIGPPPEQPQNPA
ncbi:MAG TPA: hypothetical protein V6C72_17410 [Chroococcales cyanobacterium]